MKFYLAGAYPRRNELRTLNDRLKALGFESTARWLHLEHSVTNPTDAPRLGALYARHDHDDVREADVLVFATNEPTDPYTSGGRHFEMGLAVAWLKPVVIYDPWQHQREPGRKENIFHWYDRKVYVGNTLYPAISTVVTESSLIKTLSILDARIRESQKWADETVPETNPAVAFFEERIAYAGVG